MRIKLVKQEEELGCAIACFAMVLGKTYKEIRSQFYDPFITGGTEWLDTLSFLGDQGFSLVVKYVHGYSHVNFGREEIFKPFAEAHILSLKIYANDKVNHAVVMDKDGKIFCPNGVSEEEIRKCYFVSSNIGLFKDKK